MMTAEQMRKINEKHTQKRQRKIDRRTRIENKKTAITDKKNEKTFERRFHKAIMRKIKEYSKNGGFYYSGYIDWLVKDFTGKKKEYEIIEKEVEKLRQAGFDVRFRSEYLDHDPQYALITIKWDMKKDE